MSDVEMYGYDENELLLLKIRTAEISKAINLSCVLSNKLFEEIQNTEEFGEKSRKELTAFFDLINQYHNLLCDVGKEDPGKAAEDTLNILKNNFSKFYSNSQIYKDLESLD